MNAHVGGVAAANTKFKVGDRVSLHDFPYWLKKNQRTGRVVRRAVTGRGDWTVEIDNYDDTLQFFENEMTPIPTFAVGDRVRIKSGPNNGGFGAIGDVGVVDTVDGSGGLYMKFESGAEAGESWWVNVKHLEPAPLRVEAGKTYLTADGTRVGPMVREKYGEGFTADNGHRIYREDGKRIFGGEPTLVAEAPAKPAGNAAAQVDNLADEYGGGSRGPKFKVGDRVRLVKDALSTTGAAGLTSTIESIDAGSCWPLLLRFDDGDLSKFKSVAIPGNKTRATFDVVVAAHPTTLIVALIENGQPKPATRPYIHRSREAAIAEAARLAGKHKGSEFGVFELVDTRKVEKPVYEHEWQRLAVDGKKIDAIRELRAISGMGLKPAKDAVEYFLDAA